MQEKAAAKLEAILFGRRAMRFGNALVGVRFLGGCVKCVFSV